MIPNTDLLYPIAVELVSFKVSYSATRNKPISQFRTLSIHNCITQTQRMDSQCTKTPVSDKESFFEIRDASGTLLSVSQLSENQSSKNGLSFEYKDGKLESIKEYRNGFEGLIVATFKENEMTQYENGKAVYIGAYTGSYKDGVHRNGTGQEFDSSGTKLIYKGRFVNDEREGEGYFFDAGKIRYKGHWVRGIPQGEGTIYDDDGLPLVSGILNNGYLKCDRGYYYYYKTGEIRHGCFPSCLPHWGDRKKRLKRTRKLCVCWRVMWITAREILHLICCEL